LKAFFGTTFKIKPVTPIVAVASAQAFNAVESDEENAEVVGGEVEAYILSVVGTGYTNTARKTG
jgi:RNA 3'-terminal phosphate cyclase-like protein